MFPCDAVVVLSGGILPDGTLPRPARERVRIASKLMEGGTAPCLVISGRGALQADDSVPSECRAMAAEAVRLGIPAGVILLEEASRDTFGNAYLCREIVRRHDWSRIRVVTSDFHLQRALFLFQRVLGPSVEVSGSAAPSGLSEEEMVEAMAHEIGILSMFRRLLAPVPEGDDDALDAVASLHPMFADGPTPLTPQRLVDIPWEIRRLHRVRPLRDG